ncbi:hypothetical protein ACFH1L_01730 [Klebsiella michiganensis]
MTTDITELAQRDKFEAWFKSSFHPDKTGPYIKDQLYFAWKAASAELVEALEKAQAKNALVAGGIEAVAKLHERIAALTSENAALKGSVENASGCINAAYAEGLIDVLAESSDQRLVDLVKRRLLFAYLPVEAPATDDALVAMGDAVLLEQLEDSRKAIVSQSKIIAELESRTVTVKLLDCDLAAVQHMSGGSKDYCNGFVDGTQNAIREMRAAGVDVREAE